MRKGTISDTLEPQYFEEVCANCGCTFGSHHAGNGPYPYNYCPGHEGRMDWDKGPRTVFKPSGKYKEGEGEK